MVFFSVVSFCFRQSEKSCEEEKEKREKKALLIVFVKKRDLTWLSSQRFMTFEREVSSYTQVCLTDWKSFHLNKLEKEKKSHFLPCSQMFAGDRH